MSTPHGRGSSLALSPQHPPDPTAQESSWWTSRSVDPGCAGWRKDLLRMVCSLLLVCPSSWKSLVTTALVLLGAGVSVEAVAACSSILGCSRMSFPWKTLSSCRAAMTDVPGPHPSANNR